MARREVLNNESNEWMVTFVKTVDTDHAVYYRLTNLQTYRTLVVAAHKLIDEIVNNRRIIVNLRTQNNRFVILNEDGYDGAEDIIVVDEFDSDVPNIYEWTLTHGDLGCKIIEMYDRAYNLLAPSNIKIDSDVKLHWICSNGHRIHTDFATIASLKCDCPICKAQESGKVLSFKVWANLTDNTELLEQYRSCELNTTASSNIAYDSKKKVYWRKDGVDEMASMYSVTIQGNRPFRKESDIVNLSR